MARPGLILIGAGGHARACIDVIEQAGVYAITGLVGTLDQVDTRHCGYPVLGTDDALGALAAAHPSALVAAGQIGSSALRRRLYQRAVELGYELPVVIAPGAYVSPHATLGAGSIVLHGAIVNAGAVVGRNCIINSRALVEHDALVGDHCHVATGAILNGAARLGDGGFVGSGSVVKQGVVMGNDCIIGMGLSVRHDLADGSRFSGK
ncbi:MAG: acetyltransferase [Pseudomonadota bacterium]